MQSEEQGEVPSAPSAASRMWGSTPGPPSPHRTYRRTRWALETGEASVTLHASVTWFTSFTFVTTGTLWTLEEEEEEEEELSRVQTSHCPHDNGDVETPRRMGEENMDLQQDHEHQQDQGGQRDLEDPGREEKGTG